MLRGALVQGGYAIGRLPEGAAALSLDAIAAPSAADGMFLLGFGRDSPPLVTLLATAPDGRAWRQVIRVAPRSWTISYLPTLRRTSAPSPEYEALRSGELARIRAARAATGAASDWRSRFVWPATGRVSGVFGSQRVLGGVPSDPHGGLDIARPSGWPVVAPAGGTVTLASPPRFSLEGNLVILDHGLGLSSAFLHLSRIDVTVGQRVEQGQPIGAIGATGRATGPHLHWGMVWNGVRIDPALFVGAMPVDGAAD